MVIVPVPAPSICAPIAAGIGQIDDLGLPRGVFQHRCALGQVAAISAFSVAPTDTMRKLDLAPAGRPEPGHGHSRRAGPARAHRLQRLQMQVDRARADGTAAGQRDDRLARPRQQRAQHRIEARILRTMS
jgi:hypothetical protein